MQQQFKRRFPTYMAGLVLGLAVLIVSMQLKRAFAPRFVESNDNRPGVSLAEGGSIRLRYPEEPGYFLIPGYPSELFVAEKKEGGIAEPVVRMGYRELTEKETLIGPIKNSGHYELRAYLYICSQPGDAVCAKRNLVIPIEVTPQSSSTEISLELDLRKIVKEVVAADAAAAPVTPGQSQNK